MLEVGFRHAFPGLSLDIDFAAPSGITVLFGPSGCGKSTILNAVAGLMRPDRGRIVLGGRVLTDTAAGVFVAPHRRRAPCVFQEARLFPHLGLRGNLTYARRFGRAGSTDPDEVIGRLGLAPLLDRPVAALSGGERQRVALGRALMADPAVLMLDEPLAALDAPRKAEILPLLEGLRRPGGPPVLHVTHDISEAARLADHLVLVEAGRIRAAGPAPALMADPALAGLFGASGAGGLLAARVAGVEADGLTRVETAAGPLWLPGLAAPAGAALRLRIAASEVILSRDRPQGLSALNILPARITSLTPEAGGAVLVALALGPKDAPERLLARITARSATALALAPGQDLQAIVKSAALARAV